MKKRICLLWMLTSLLLVGCGDHTEVTKVQSIEPGTGKLPETVTGTDAENESQPLDEQAVTDDAESAAETDTPFRGRIQSTGKNPAIGAETPVLPPLPCASPQKERDQRPDKARSPPSHKKASVRQIPLPAWERGPRDAL